MTTRFFWQAALQLLFLSTRTSSHEASVSSRHFLSTETTHSATVHVHQTIELMNAELTRLPRKLQGNCGEFTPDSVCASFAASEEFNQTFACSCLYYGEDVQVDCDYRQKQCNSDGSLCYMGSIQRILELGATSDEESNSTTAILSRAATTCTSFTTDENESQTCIRIIPKISGNFSELDSCFVQYTPTTGADPKECSECTPCGTGENGQPEISFTCCNVETDVKQTCGPSQDGVAVPVFDIIPASEQGMCVSAGAARSFSLVVGAISFATLLFWIQE